MGRSFLLFAVMLALPSVAFAQAAKTPAPAANKKKAADKAAKDAKKPAEKADAPPPGPGTPSGTPNPDAKADVSPDKKPSTRYFEGMGHTPEEQKQLEELTHALEQYESESKEFKREVQLLVEKKYEEKRNTLSNSYEKAIRDLEVLERKERLDAIAQFEEFLQRYPNDPKYTPDVMFRLAELYYEQQQQTITFSRCATTKSS